MNGLTHEQWAAVADAYTPLLVIAWILVFIRAARVPEFPVVKHLSAYVGSVACVYVLMFADKWLSIWPEFGLDYSTHTALALVFVMGLAGFGRKLALVAVGSLLLYMVLMHYQAYHAWMDMLSTALVIAPIHYWVGNIARVRILD